MTKYLDPSNNTAYAKQNGAKTRIAYNENELNAIFENARNGVVYNVDELELPSFIDKAAMQRNLWTAELYYLKNNDTTNERISELEELLAPAQNGDTEEAETERETYETAQAEARRQAIEEQNEDEQRNT